MNEKIKVADGQEGVPLAEKVIEIVKETVETKTYAELDAEREAEIAEIQRRIDGLTAMRDEKRAAWDAEKSALVK